MQNFYDLLGVRPDDDTEIIKKAFRQAAKASHPDHHGGDPAAAARFRAISEAYEVLRDAELRADYDELIEPDLKPLLHGWKRFAAAARRHAGDVAVAAVLTVTLTAGYKFYDRLPGLHRDSPAAVTARQSPPAAEPEGQRAVPPQMPLLPAATAANNPDRADTASREPAAPRLAVAVPHDEPEVAADTGGGKRTTVDEPAVGPDARPSPASPPATAERNGTAGDDVHDARAPDPAAANGGVKPPEVKTVAPAPVKRHAPIRRPVQQAALDSARRPADAAAPTPQARPQAQAQQTQAQQSQAQPGPAAEADPPSRAPARVLGVGF